MKTSSRLAKIVSGAAIVAVALTGCGSTDDTEDTSDAATELMPEGEGKTEYPLTLETP